MGKIFDFKSEAEWLEEKGDGAVIKIQVNLGSAVESELGVPSVTVEMPLTETSRAIKTKLVAMGVKTMPENKMQIHLEDIGFLKDRHSFAYYNLADGVTCSLREAKRGGSRYRADHAVMPKRPQAQVKPAEAKAPAAANSPLDALKSLGTGGKLLSMLGLPNGLALPK